MASDFIYCDQIFDFICRLQVMSTIHLPLLLATGSRLKSVSVWTGPQSLNREHAFIKPSL